MQTIPNRTKQCRTKVTKFFVGDEKFRRQKIISDGKLCPKQKIE